VFMGTETVTNSAHADGSGRRDPKGWMVVCPAVVWRNFNTITVAQRQEKQDK
jgi:hypothetical protein